MYSAAEDPYTLQLFQSVSLAKLQMEQFRFDLNIKCVEIEECFRAVATKRCML